MPQTLNLESIVEAGHLTFNIIRTLPDARVNERWVHGVVLGILEAKVGDMQYEHEVDDGRIDMRHGSSNPDVMEFVLVRNGNEWHASQNKSELRKLSRTSGRYARRRILFILHPFGSSIPVEQMKENYRNYAKNVQARFGEESVRVVYVHPRSDYNFIWAPPILVRPRSRQRLG
jgi:hypothetical protein